MTDTTPQDIMATARFWSKVRVGRPGVCWPWQEKSRNEFGYGIFRAPGDIGLVKAHRFAWMQANGHLHPDVVIRHKCDNPPCCNPAHLLAGTQQDNISDIHERKRRNYNVRMTPSLLREVKSRVRAGETQTSVAKDLGFTQAYISLLLSENRGAAIRKGIATHGE